MSEQSANGIEQVSDEGLEDAAAELREVASFVGWTDEEREDEFLAIVDHLRGLKSDKSSTGTEQSEADSA